MNTYFNIRFELDKQEVLRRIDQQVTSDKAAYVCVTDGVILNTANRTPDYLEVVNGSMFSICDSSFIPLYLRLLYGLKVEQYCGYDIMGDIVRMKKYRMAFLGGTQQALDGLRNNLQHTDERIADMLFYELPFRDVNNFDYEGIARMVNDDKADIIWVSLGAPKQEMFMNRLLPHLQRGVMIAVGAAFNFYSGQGEQRAPRWMVDHHLEFLYRIGKSPKKQLKRCAWIIRTLPELLRTEWQSKKRQQHVADKQ